MSTFLETLDQIKVVRLELHEELMKVPQYRALVSLDDLLRIIEKATGNDVQEKPRAVPEPIAEPAKPIKLVHPIKQVMPVDAPQPIIHNADKKGSKTLTQVQALLKLLRDKDTPASLSWLLAEVQLLGVNVGGVSPKRTLGVALSSNKDLFRRIEIDGNRWMWGLTGRRYAGETSFTNPDHGAFKSMRVAKKR